MVRNSQDVLFYSKLDSDMEVGTTGREFVSRLEYSVVKLQHHT